MISSIKNSKFLVKNIKFYTAYQTRLFLTANLKELDQFPKEINSYESLYKFSIEHSDKFWSVLARSRLQWHKDFTKVTSGNFGDSDFRLKWFLNGKLNASGK
jgi:hypothetical protein